METINRFSSTSTSDTSPRRSLSSQISASGMRRSLQTPVSSTMAVHDPQSSVDSRVTASAASSTHSQDDPNRWFENFRDDADETSEFTDDLPTPEQLATAENIPIYDAEGNARPFRHLYQGSDHQGQRQLIIFVRHFYCGGCQNYVRALIDTITPSRYFSLPIPTTITLISCGRPSLLPKYQAKTACPFRLYSDPSRKLYKALKMPFTFTVGKSNSYIDETHFATAKNSFGQMFKAGAKDAFGGGNWFQVGGEFLFENGAPLWCHRMRDMRGHAEMPVIARVLNMSSDELREVAKGASLEESNDDNYTAQLEKAENGVELDNIVISKPKQAVTPRNKPIKPVWEDRGDRAPPKVRLQRGK